jgi:hypothetical protein
MRITRATKRDLGDSPKAAEIVCPSCVRVVAWARDTESGMQISRVENVAIDRHLARQIGEALGDITANASMRMPTWTTVDPATLYEFACCVELELDGQRILSEISHARTRKVRIRAHRRATG